MNDNRDLDPGQYETGIEFTCWGGCLFAAIAAWLLLISFLGGLISFFEWVGRL